MSEFLPILIDESPGSESGVVVSAVDNPPLEVLHHNDAVVLSTEQNIPTEPHEANPFAAGILIGALTIGSFAASIRHSRTRRRASPDWADYDNSAE